MTVVADESYAAFAEGLQREMETDLGIRFGTVDPDGFAALTYENSDGELTPFGVAESKALFDVLQRQDLIDARGRIQDSLRRELKAGTLELPDRFEHVALGVRALLTKLAGRLEVRDSDNKRPITLNRQVYLSDEFRALWDRIKAKTTYRVAFDNDALVATAVSRLKTAPAISRAQARWRKAQMELSKAGVAGVKETTSGFIGLTPEAFDVPDVLGELQNRTQLTRRTLARILIDSGRLDDLRENPAAFIDQAADLINRVKVAVLVDGVRYQKIGADSYYAQELFDAGELQGYLDRMVSVTKAVTQEIRYDAAIERSFAEELDANEAVKVFAKLPDWFKIPTPLGSYNPDWAVLVTTHAGDRLYFVVETKGSLLIEDLRANEAAKIKCGEAHFAELAQSTNEPQFIKAETVADLLRATAK